MYEIPGSNIRQVKITEDAVMGRSKPEYSELVRDKTSKIIHQSMMSLKFKKAELQILEISIFYYQNMEETRNKMLQILIKKIDIISKQFNKQTNNL